MCDDITFVLLFLKIIFYQCIVVLQCCVNFYLTAKQISHVYVSPPCSVVPSHLGHHGASSRVPCAVQQILISYLFNMQYYVCLPQSPNSSHHSLYPPWFPYVCSLCMCLYFCPVGKIISTPFFFWIPHIYQYTIFVFSF